MIAWAVLVLCVGVMLAFLVLDAWSKRRASRSRPSITTRAPPVLHSVAEPEEIITVAGRTYEIVMEPCPWCLSVPAPDENVVRCRNQHCQRVGHKRCNDRNGGCGGVCSVLGT